MVSSPVRQAPPRPLIAEKYINQRTQSFTRTHARSMQEWKDAHGGSVDGYFDDYRKRMDRMEQKYLDAAAKIDANPAMTYRDRIKEKDALPRIYPAWTAEQERAFISQWGDPREVDRSRLNDLLDALRSTVHVGARRVAPTGDPYETDIPKTEFEMLFYDALVNPQDGSVPLALEVPSFRAAPSGPQPSAAIGQVSADPTIQRMAEEYAKNVCPFCKQHFGRLNKNHTDKCKANPENASAPSGEAELSI